MLWDVGVLVVTGPTMRFVKFLFFSILVCGSSRPYFKKILKVTDTAIILLNGPSASHPGPLWAWQIPPLTTNTLFDEEHLPQVPQVLIFQEPVSSGCHKPDQWYYDDLNSLPLYFDVFERGDYGDFTRCKLDIASDLSDLSLVPVADLCMRESIGHTTRYHLVAYRICEDRPVNVYNHYMQLETYTRLTSSGTTVGSPTIDVNVTPFFEFAKPSTIYSLCPASGRLVWKPDDQDLPYWGTIAIFDFL